MNLELKDKVAFVAGASQGMGAAVAKGLSSEGAIVYACARTKVLLQYPVRIMAELSCAR